MAGLASRVIAASTRRFLVARTRVTHMLAPRELAARPAVALVPVARRANRQNCTAKRADKVAADDLVCALQAHGCPGRETLDKSPLSCGNPPWQTALRWLEQARGGTSPNCTHRACWPRHRKCAANCLNCKEIDVWRWAEERPMCAVAQVPETYGFMPMRDSGRLASTRAHARSRCAPASRARRTTLASLRGSGGTSGGVRGKSRNVAERGSRQHMVPCGRFSGQNPASRQSVNTKYVRIAWMSSTGPPASLTAML